VPPEIDSGIGPPWHAIWTRSHCERLVRDQLAARGLHPFMPTIAIWSRANGTQHRIGLPMFPGYVFLHDSVDKLRYLEVRKARGVVALLGERWDRLAVIPEREMASIERLAAAGLDVAPHPFLRAGEPVRVVHGALTGVEGLLLKIDARKGRLVVSIELLHRSVAVELDCSSVAPA
jgi:transcription antitermination factor NusG